MANAPWDADHELGPDRVAEVLAEQFPDLAPVRVAYLNEGWDSQAFLVNGNLVFRFPKREEVDASLATEIALLPELARRVPVAIPGFRWIGRPVGVPYRFVGYPLIEGVIGRSVDLSGDMIPGVARDLGAVLEAVHSFRIEDAERLGVRRAGWRDPARLLRRAAELLPQVRGALTGELAARLERFLAAAPPPAFAGTPLLLHADLTAEHIILRHGRIAGVIDWGDVLLGDPAVDFAGAFHWDGPRLYEAVLERYRLPVDAELPLRARFVAACVGVYDLAYGLETGREGYVRGGIRSLERNLS